MIVTSFDQLQIADIVKWTNAGKSHYWIIELYKVDTSFIGPCFIGQCVLSSYAYTLSSYTVDKSWIQNGTLEILNPRKPK